MFSVMHSPILYQVLCIFLFMNLKEKKGKNWREIGRFVFWILMLKNPSKVNACMNV